MKNQYIAHLRAAGFRTIDTNGLIDDFWTNEGSTWVITLDWQHGAWCLYKDGEDEPTSEGLLAALPELLKELTSG
jgi:hypothetical protein